MFNPKINNIFNKVYKCWLLVLVMLFFFSLFSITVSAEKVHTCGMCGSLHDLDELGGIQEFAYNVSESVYGKEMFDDINGYLKFDITTGSEDSTASNYNAMKRLWSVAETFYQMLLPIGYTLTIIYASIDLFENMNKDTLTPENLAKQLIKILFSIVMLSMGFELITAFVGVSNAAFDLLSNGLSSVSNSYGSGGASSALCNFATLKETDILGAIGVAFHLFVPWIAMKVAVVACFIVIWARVLEIIVRTIFAPLGLADLLSGGRNSNGFKYLKRLFAALMVGVVLNAIMTGYTFIMAALGSGSFIVVLVVTYTMLTTIMKSTELSKDMIGV